MKKTALLLFLAWGLIVSPLIAQDIPQKFVESFGVTWGLSDPWMGSIVSQLPADAEIIDYGVATDGNGSEVVKVRLKQGSHFQSLLFDKVTGKSIVRTFQPAAGFTSKSLQQVLDVVSDDTEVEVNIMLVDDPDHILPESSYSIVGELVEGEVINLKIDGRSASSKDLEKAQRGIRKNLENLAKDRKARRQNKFQQLLNRMNWNDVSAMKALEDGGISVKRKLKKSDIQRLQQHQDLVQGVTLSTTEKQTRDDSVDEAMRITNVKQWGIDYGRTGSGIGIYMREAGGANCPQDNDSFSHPDEDIPDNQLHLIASPPSSSDLHARQVGAILHKVAPSSDIYCGNSRTPSNPMGQSPTPIYVATHSYNSNSSTIYQAQDQFLDNYVYNDRIAVFAAAGNRDNDNPNGNVSTPGKAYNVISVSHFAHQTNNMSSKAVTGQPATGAKKPEISAPGVSLALGNWVEMDGSSFASPFAAAFAADLMSSYTHLKGEPELMKAMLMSGALNNITGSTTSGIDGAGAIDFFHIYYSGRFATWHGNNNDHFVNEKIIRTENLDPGTYRIAIAWSVPIADWRNANTIPMDLDLKVYYSGGGAPQLVAQGTNRDSAFEIVEFNASRGFHFIEIIRYTNNDSNAKVHVGYHLDPTNTSPWWR